MPSFNDGKAQGKIVLLILLAAFFVLPLASGYTTLPAADTTEALHSFIAASLAYWNDVVTLAEKTLRDEAPNPSADQRQQTERANETGPTPPTPNTTAVLFPEEEETPPPTATTPTRPSPTPAAAAPAAKTPSANSTQPVREPRGAVGVRPGAD